MSGGAGDRVSYLGHSTVALDLDGARILTDPMLRRRAGLLRRHPAEVDPTAYQGVDVVLISHLHRDHLDLSSLRLLPVGTPLIVPRGGGGILAGTGLGPVTEVGVGEKVTVGPLEVSATPAEHDGRRDPWGSAADPVGYVASAAGRRAYFAGDTDLFEEMADLGPLDLALVPVWGWGHRLGAGHLDPERAAAALSLLRPRIAIPIHWGTYHPAGMKRSLGNRLTEPPHEFARLAAEAAPEVRVEVLQPGAGLDLESGPR